MTLTELRPVMTPTQRQRAEALLDAVQNLKDEVVRYGAEFAPQFPQSSIGPHRFDASHDLTLDHGECGRVR